MQKIKVAELFYSIQGEGRYMGVPSIFLRTFGCNFQCQGFGMPKGQLSGEREQIDPEKYSDYKDLPLVHTGCDSYASWDVRFKHLSPVLTTKEISDKILELLPYNEWRDEHLVITGGEPLLGWQRAYPELLERCYGLKEITFETNGTQQITDEFETDLIRWSDWRMGHDCITFSISPKLSESGEKWEDAIKPDVVAQYDQIGYAYLKFVISRKESLDEVQEAVWMYEKAGFRGPVYLMPVGGTETHYSINSRQVAEMALSKGWRYSDRLQVPLWKNAWNT